MPFRFNTISEVEILRSPGGRTMMDAINYSGNRSSVITGCPGSGKTTVTIMRAARLSNEKKRVLVITFQNMLRLSLENISAPTLRRNISGFYEWYVRSAKCYLNPSDTSETMITRLSNVSKFDEILIDEGQDFEPRIFETLAAISNRISVGADTAQRIHERGLESNQIIKLVEQEHGEINRVDLLYNYRNNYETYLFGTFFVPDMLRAANPVALDRMTKGRGLKPRVFQAVDENEEKQIINTRLRDAGDVNVAILVYHKEEVENYYRIVSEELKIRCSKYYHEMSKEDKVLTESNLENVLVTTYKSAKGLEFQIVIMPNMQTAMDASYKTNEHYYVGCTRAKEGLFLIFRGQFKPGYLAKFDESSFDYLASNGSFSAVNNDALDDLPF